MPSRSSPISPIKLQNTSTDPLFAKDSAETETNNHQCLCVFLCIYWEFAKCEAPLCYIYKKNLMR